MFSYFENQVITIPNLRLIYERKIFRCHGRSLLNFVSNNPLLHQISKFWDFITVLKLLRALSKSSARSSEHLNLEFESVPAAATCRSVLLANLFFIELFRIQILLLSWGFFINLCMC